MAYVNDELIDNLRKAMDRHAMTGSTLELLGAASEIVGEAGGPPKGVTALCDRGDEVWFKQTGHWCLWPDCVNPSGQPVESGHMRAHGRSLEYITEHYGPLTPVEDERN